MRLYRALLFAGFFLTGCRRGEPIKLDDKLEVAPIVLRQVRLFDAMPLNLRESGFFMSQIDVAVLLNRCHSQTELPQALRTLVAPGRPLKGWILQLKWVRFRERGVLNDLGFFASMPPTYECLFEFPEKAAGSDVSFSGISYDFQKDRASAPDPMFKDLRDGDWVRINGFFRPNSGVSWQDLKIPNWLTLGKVVVTRIERIKE
jgi:hypothetical protein